MKLNPDRKDITTIGLNNSSTLARISGEVISDFVNRFDQYLQTHTVNSYITQLFIFGCLDDSLERTIDTYLARCRVFAEELHREVANFNQQDTAPLAYLKLMGHKASSDVVEAIIGSLPEQLSGIITNLKIDYIIQTLLVEKVYRPELATVEHLDPVIKDRLLSKILHSIGPNSKQLLPITHFDLLLYSIFLFPELLEDPIRTQILEYVNGEINAEQTMMQVDYWLGVLLILVLEHNYMRLDNKGNLIINSLPAQSTLTLQSDLLI